MGRLGVWFWLVRAGRSVGRLKKTNKDGHALEAWNGSVITTQPARRRERAQPPDNGCGLGVVASGKGLGCR